MCGIAGFLSGHSLDVLKRMNDALIHRGPDDSGEFHDPASGIGLAQRRLSIIDLSPRGHQPMWDVRKQVVITFNGEIYNFRELREGLVKDGFEFNSTSDTEVILNLYLRDGPSFVSKLNGIFAFGLWDPRTQQLMVARDGMGVKPFYYVDGPGGFLFASELKALLQCPGWDREIDPIAAAQYVSYLYGPAPRTMFKQVRKLLPGHAILVGKAGRKEWCFYDIPANQQPVDMPFDEACAGLRKAIETAVERQMVADVPIGAFLSGGLDSSSVVAFARKHALDGKLQCFTIGFKPESNQNEGMVDDLPYAERVAKTLGVDLKTIWVGPEITSHVEKMVYHLDEPQGDPAAINAYLICKLARESGIKVLLSGGGGDDVLTGYRRHYAMTQESWWGWMPKSARTLLRVASSKAPAGSAWGRRLSKAFAYADWSEEDRLAGYFLWMQPELLRTIAGPALSGAVSDDQILAPFREALKVTEGAGKLNRMLYLEGKYFLCDHNLNYTDKMAMATGVEVRVPLLDPDLVSYAYSLPEDYRQHGREGKYIFKKAMEGILPNDVIYRPKTGFGVPLRHWLKHELKEMVNDTLSKEALLKRGLFDYDGVRRLIEMDRQGVVDATYPIFGLVCIELWMRQFVDGGKV